MVDVRSPKRHLLARVSVPGKLILIGEHAAVYGRPALVAATSLRLRVDVLGGSKAGVEVDLPPLQHRSHVSWDEISRHADDMRQRWESYDADPSPQTFANLREDRADHLVLVALGEAIATLGEDPRLESHPLAAVRLCVESTVPVGAGFGSSAAAAVAIVAAVGALCGKTARWSRIGPIAGQVERRQHGAPSGVDVATVFHGGVLRLRRTGEELSIEPLAARSDTLRRLRIFDTGPTTDPTGTMVAAVRAQRARDRGRFDVALDAVESATRAFQLAVTASAAEGDLVAPMRTAQRYLESIGVVPEPIQVAVRSVEALGGAAKISGSGALQGPGAGSLLVLLPDGVDDLPQALERLPEHDVMLGAEGVRVEVVA